MMNSKEKWFPRKEEWKEWKTIFVDESSPFIMKNGGKINFRPYFDAEKLEGWDEVWKAEGTVEITLEATKFAAFCNYNERIDYLLENNKIDFPFPNITLNLEDAKILANKLISYFDWMVPVEINFVKPEKQSPFNRYFSWVDSIPLAAIYNDYISYNKKCVGVSDIYICRKEFLTIGVLIHELAHMYNPVDDHGEDFYFALNEVTRKYWSMRQFN